MTQNSAKDTFDDLYAMQGVRALGALLAAVEASGSPHAMRGLAELLSQAEASRTLASNVGSMITDLFGGSDPRKVAEAARGALALYSVTKGVGPGAELFKRMQNSSE